MSRAPILAPQDEPDGTIIDEHGFRAGAVAAAVLRLPSRGAGVCLVFAGGVLLAAVAFELVPDADARARLWMSAVGLLAGTLIYLGADTWLSRNEEMKAMRRTVHAAAAGRLLERSQATVELARGETIAAGLVVDGVPSRSRLA
jgi:ZIP family zinc transporter